MAHFYSSAGAVCVCVCVSISKENNYTWILGEWLMRCQFKQRKWPNKLCRVKVCVGSAHLGIDVCESLLE